MAGSEKIWAALKGDVLGDRPILLDTGLIRIEAPKRAQDAALVPVDIYLDPAKASGVKKVTMVIDVNPSPVAATFHIGKDAGVTHLATRVRVDDYSWLRVIAETESGELHMSQTFVKASGGCSAPAAKNADEAKVSLGQLRFRQFAREGESAATRAREAQIMIRHPNNSGLQMDQVTRLYTPAFFVRDLAVVQDDELVLKMESGISLSEDPNIRFTYRPNGATTMRAEAIDTDGHRFAGEWPIETSEM
jgi:sulfur-oxidizing protein SoxY